MRAVELSGAGINGSRFDCVRHVIHRQSPRSQRRRIGLDPDCALDAVNIHLRDTGKNGDALGHRRGGVLI